MELTPATALAYIGDAYTKMLAVVDRLGDDKVNVKPHGPTTNSAAALVVHCCGVTRWWLSAVGLGRTVERNRDAEFEATATVAELHALVAATLAQATSDVEAFDAGQSVPGHPGRSHLVESSDASLVIHVIEELYQHLGHMELTADALAVGKGAAQG